MPGATTASGKVASVKPWKKGNGYFMNLEDDQNDYYAFGHCSANEGDTVELEVSEGTGGFSDKICINKILKSSGRKWKGKIEKDEDAEEGPAVQEKPAYSGLSRDESIQKQCCLKAAARLVGIVNSGNKEADIKKLTEQAMNMANRFYIEFLVGLEPDMEEGK